MIIENFIPERLKKIFNLLQDKESQDIFMNFLNYYLSEDPRVFCNRKYSYIESDRKRIDNSLDYFIYNFDNIDANEKQELILFGVTMISKSVLVSLEALNIKVSYFCDYNEEMQNELYGGIPVLSPEAVVNEHKNSTILFLDDMNMANKFIYYALKNGMKESHFKLHHKIDKMYFGLKCFQPGDKEIFVDGGSYNGDTILDYVIWCNGKYSKIYAIEPDCINQKELQNTVSDNNLSNVQIIKGGLWSGPSLLKFKGDGTQASQINDDGDISVQVNSIDNIVGNDPVTFIKLDIEGAELEALKGAVNTICNNKPRLAICIYHKPEDILQIPLYINQLVPEYKFYLRQHSSINVDAVLYAII